LRYAISAARTGAVPAIKVSFRETTDLAIPKKWSQPIVKTAGTHSAA